MRLVGAHVAQPALVDGTSSATGLPLPLCLVDDATRESPAPLPVGGARIVRLLDEVATHTSCRRRSPLTTGRSSPAGRCSRSRAERVRLRLLHPGKLIQNAFVGSFVGCFRDKCVNQYWFGLLAERGIIKAAALQPGATMQCARLQTAGATRAPARLR